MAVGLTTIVTSVIELLFEWADTGEIRKKSRATAGTSVRGLFERR